MLNKVIISFCIIDDLLKVLLYRDDHQAKASASKIITIAILACQEFGGKFRKALAFIQEQKLFSFVPSESQLGCRLHQLMDVLQVIWEKIEGFPDYAIDTFPIPVCKNIRVNRCKIAPGKVFRGWIPSHREYFHGLKLHLIVSGGGSIIPNITPLAVNT